MFKRKKTETEKNYYEVTPVFSPNKAWRISYYESFGPDNFSYEDLGEATSPESAKKRCKEHQELLKERKKFLIENQPFRIEIDEIES